MKKTITRLELAGALAKATKEVEICVPSGDYYARSDDWQKETLRYIDPRVLLEALKEEQ